MLWTTFFLALLVAAGAAAYVLWPMLTRTAPAVPLEDDRLTELISRKDSALVAIKDLEFDHQVGKLSDEDYTRFDARLRQQAIAYLQQIDKLVPQSQEMDISLEAEIARLRKTRKATVAVNGNGASALAVKPAAKSIEQSTEEEATARFCTNCGQALSLQHKFCAQCGTAV